VTYTKDDLIKMYCVGTRAGIIAYHMALIERGEEDGVLLRGLKERAKKAIKDAGDEPFADALKALEEEKANGAKAGE
jgi:hypothetical protein